MDKEKITILLVDDHTIFRSGLKLLLSSQPNMKIVGEAGDGEEALGLIEKLKPKVVLMDISMPNMNGIEATKYIKRKWPEVNVLILTMHDDEIFLFNIVNAGGSGYLLKQVADTNLIYAIEEVSKGEIFIMPNITKILVKDYLERIKNKDELKNLASLTKREEEILAMIAHGHTNQSIADKFFISIRTVETHRAHIMEKLRIKTRVELVNYARRKHLIN